MTDETSEELESRIESWLSVQMPRIQSHGGTSAVREVDRDRGEVVVELGGACSGCGISQTTEQTLETELTRQFEAITTVRVEYLGNDDWAVDQPENYMGIDRTQGGRGGSGKSRPVTDFF
ncbi:MAG: NifU family protein [Halodesulfurarchaeum sp.]